MQLTTKGRYAVSAMFDLAAHSKGEPITAEAIAKRQMISRSYLDQLLLKLRRAGLVKTVRGPSGGYKLSKKPSQISVGAIIEATEGPIALAHCVHAASECPKSGCCSTRSLWGKLSAKVAKVMHSINLGDLCRELS